MRIPSLQRRGAVLDRLTPQSLRAQFAVALCAMGLLIVAGGATAFFALIATGNAVRQFSEEQLARVQDTQDLQQRTLQIQLLAERMIMADSRAVARQTYAQILSELNALDQLTARLAVNEDASVLDLHQSSQLFRNSAHVLAQLGDAAARPGPADVPATTALKTYREEMQVHAQALAQSAREQLDRLARARQAAVLRVVDASHTSAYWVVAWLAFSLVAGWLIARVFLGQHVIARLQQVSRSLLAVDDDDRLSQPHVAVHGDDEIGAMARAVERFLSDRRQLARTRTQLEAEQQRLTAIIDNTADSIVVLQGGRVLQLNRAAERMFGVSHAQAVDQPGDALLVDFDWNPGAAPGIARDALARSRNGQTIPVEVSLNPVTSGTGNLVVLVIRDATLRRQAEQHLIAARDAAESARATQAIFLANISHELRTPLNGILGFAQILRRDKPLTERQARGLQIIEESGQHLLTLINDILDLARIDEARLELHPTEVDLAAFLQVVCDIIRVKAEEKRLSFVYEASPDLPVAAVIDEKRLRQVLLNLLSNAVKFSDTGQVTLRARPVPPAPGSSAGGGLRFEIEDRGIGMNEAQVARLFQPFAQVADYQRREGGAGLGLAISRQLVRLMGGDIQVRSRQGEGSVFSFEIDAPAPQPALRFEEAGGPAIGTASPQPTPPESGHETLSDDRDIVNGAHMLLVEDNAINRELVLELLHAAGVVVSIACDGQEALDILERQRFDAVLMDCLMPVMDGYAATRALRMRPELQALPVIALTANAMVGDRDKALAAGMNDHIAKPIKLDELFATLARWVRPAGAVAAESIGVAGSGAGIAADGQARTTRQ